MNQTEYRGVSSSRNDVPVAVEPGLINRSHELIGYLHELEDTQAAIREKLNGPFPKSDSPALKSAHEPSIRDLLATACERAACLAGEAKSLLALL